MLDLNTLKVNDRVAVARSGNWNVHSEGIYVVKKANKVRIILGRESDGYEREFSTKIGTEKGASRYRSPFIESVADKVARDKAEAEKHAERAAWELVGKMAKDCNLAGLKEAVAALEARAWKN